MSLFVCVFVRLFVSVNVHCLLWLTVLCFPLLQKPLWPVSTFTSADNAQAVQEARDTVRQLSHALTSVRCPCILCV